MKLSFKALIVAAFFCLSFTISAQQVYEWDHYKMSVELPNDFKVVKNTDTEFECDGKGMNLFMYVFDDGDVTLKDMHDATRKLAKEMKFETKDDDYAVDYNGFQGKYILGLKDGLQVMICGLINPQSHANFFIIIVFEDGDNTAEDEGIKILNSLKNDGWFFWKKTLNTEGVLTIVK